MPLTVTTADLHDPDHAKHIVALLDMYSRDSMGDAAPLADTARAELIAGLRRHPLSLVLLAWQDDTAVGVCVAFEGFSTFHARPLLNIHDLAVHPLHRNQGVGGALLTAVEAQARRRGCCKLTLEVRADNAAAQHLYRRAGFGEPTPVMHFWQKPLAGG